MLSALLIVFREVIEAGLIVGIVLAATKGVPRRDFAVSLGVLAGGGVGVALFLRRRGRIAAAAPAALSPDEQAEYDRILGASDRA